MKKVLVFCVLLSLWLSLDGSSVWAIVDVGWMQKGVRVWYFGAAGTGMSSDAEEAYLFTSIDGNNAQLIHHSAINHWSLPNAAGTETGSILGKGPFWIHPQVLQTIAIGDNWMGITITWVERATYTYDTFKNTGELSSLPYLLLPIKTLFNLNNEREIVKLVYGRQYFDDVWGTAYFDAETGLCLFNLKLTVFNTVFFILSEINYDFENHEAFAEDNGPHTGFKSNIIKTSSSANYVMIQSSVETRYGNTVQMWVSTSAGGSIDIYAPPNENYCFFGDVPVLRRKYMTDTPHYPPEGWNEYGDYLWWWVPQEALQSSSIDIVNVPMTRTSTAPYTFEATGAGTGLYFPDIIFDNDGYMTDFSAKYSAIGLNIDLGPSASAGVPIHLVDGLEYYRNTMGRAMPAPGAATLISPSGTIITTTPTYTWNAVATATEYELRVDDSTGNRILQWYTASEAGCASGVGICSVTPATALAAGPGQWWIQTKNSAGTGALSDGMSFMIEGVSAPGVPDGPRNVETNTSHAYTVSGSTSNVGDSIQYFIDWGDGTNSNWLPAGTMSPSHLWASAGTYSVKARARCATHTSVVSSWSETLSVTVETVSVPRTPSGLASGTAGVSSVYSTGDSTSELGHSIQYLFDWGDGTNSGWLPVGTSSASKSWVFGGTYVIKAQARCATHTDIVSNWSPTLSVDIIGPPLAATLISPTGTITDTTPTYAWNAVSNATWYCLYVNDSTGNKINQWYTRGEAGCASGTGTCSVTPTAEVIGSGQWWVRTYNSVGLGPWSSGMSFTVATPTAPSAANQVSPTGAIGDTTPTYTWNAVSNATWYCLYVNDSTGNKINQWYTRAQANCPLGTGNCTATPTTEVRGAGQWWVRTYNSGGLGAWSSGMSFTVATPTAPSAANQVSPTGAISDPTPTYAWNAVSNATWYCLYVNDSTGNKINQWYAAADAGCADGVGTCTVTPTTEVRGAGQWWVRTYNSGGLGAWSSGMSFTAPTPTAPSAATQVSPTGAISDTTPTYTWNPVASANWYQLWVGDASGTKINQWYAAADAGCADGVGTCSVTPSTMVLGPMNWYIQTYNSGGLGPWSSGMSFTVSP